MYQTIRTPQMFPELGQLVCGGYDVFNDWWSTFIPEHKKALEEKIVRYYWFNQIGAETPDRFKHFLNAELMRVMPYYNQLYESELIKFNPMLNQLVKRNGRNVENLLRVANSDETTAGKILRDFVNSHKDDEFTKGNLTGAYDSTEDHTANTDYTKDGTKTSKEVVDEDVVGTKDSTTNVVEDTTENNSKDTTRELTENRTLEETVATTRDTTTDTSGNGQTDGTLSRNVSTDGTKLYSDTPQKSLTTSGQPGNSVLWNYLTNATNTSENQDTDESTHSENTYTENKKEKMTENVTKNVTENETENETINETEDKDKHFTGDTTYHEDTKEDTNRTTDYNEGWHEEGNEKLVENTTGHKDTVEDTTSERHAAGIEQGKTDEKSTTSKGKKEDESQSKENSEDEYISGYNGISASELLMAFRDTFINVDDMIIGAIRNCFMEVF